LKTTCDCLWVFVKGLQHGGSCIRPIDIVVVEVEQRCVLIVLIDHSDRMEVKATVRSEIDALGSEKFQLARLVNETFTTFRCDIALWIVLKHRQTHFLRSSESTVSRFVHST